MTDHPFDGPHCRANELPDEVMLHHLFAHNTELLTVAMLLAHLIHLSK